MLARGVDTGYPRVYRRRMVQTIEIPTYECLRCGHTWHPRQPERPRLCPRCKTVRWDTERRNGQGKEPVKAS